MKTEVVRQKADGPNISGYIILGYFILQPLSFSLNRRFV